MTVLSFSSGDRFFCRVWKDDAQDEAIKWTNVYEVQATSGGTLTDLQDLGGKLVLYESAFHLTSVRFTQFEVGTWEPDSKPYNPEAFYSEALVAGTFGLRTLPPATNQLPLSVCLSCRRVVQTGRQGKLYYRGVLHEGDVEKAGSGWGLSAASTIFSEFSDAVEGIQGYIQGVLFPLRFHLIGKVKGGTVYSRPVLDIVAYDAVTVQLEHAWYNRAQTPGML